MKKILSTLFPLFLLTVFAACDDTKSYSELQDEEIITIQNYIQQNNIQVVTTKPAENGGEPTCTIKPLPGFTFIWLLPVTKLTHSKLILLSVIGS